ncbi:MAG TPA: hypothetical protein VFO52_01000 [Longimicrobiales bacterium]|nr:hypothetical protein [Longimicrobiales bacterium]
MSPRRWFVLTACICGALPLQAQTVRMNGSTHMRYIELRPLVADSIDATLAIGEGLLRQTSDGRIVRCLPGEAFCRDVRPGARISTIPLIQDVELSAWGFGRGAYVFAQLRGRSALRGSALWPQADDALDVLAAYAELARGQFRLRAGRQWKVSGLGFYNFDGIALEARPFNVASIEVYGGRSLLRGLNESRTGGALESIEELAPPVAGLLLGVHARYQPSRLFALSSVYQVDFRNDGGGLFSELLASDATLRLGRFDIDGALEVDVAGAAINEARLRVRTPLADRFALQAELRQYRPYFELWTIWGAFSPVGYDEARAGVTWADVAGRLVIQGEAIYRAYGDTEADESLAEFRHQGWGAALNASWSPAPDWRINAGYRAEAGFGAARREAQAGATRQLGERATVALQAVAFERLYEFRLDEGTVLGLGGEASLRVSERFQVVAGGASYWHLHGDALTGSDWNQRRASLRVQWSVGSEPGMLAGQP